MQYASITGWYDGGMFLSFDDIEDAAAHLFPGQAEAAVDARANFVAEIELVMYVASHNRLGDCRTQAEAIDYARTYGTMYIPANFIHNVQGAFTHHLWGNGPFYVTRSRIMPILHGTYGGIRINQNAQAIRGENRHVEAQTLAEAALDNVIVGLYAAGTAARPPRTAQPSLTAGAWGIAAANHIMGRPVFDASYWD